MRKSVFLYIFLLVFMAFQPHLLAKEEIAMPYFGVGANVQQSDEGYLVKTKGEKAEEGFVYTPKKEFTSNQITYRLDLKGKAPVKLKIAETNSRGRFIRDEEMMINLTDVWKVYEFPYQLESENSQVDVFVLTQDKLKTEFHFKNLELTETFDGH